jgi:hypothetical protein
VKELENVTIWLSQKCEWKIILKSEKKLENVTARFGWARFGVACVYVLLETVKPNTQTLPESGLTCQNENKPEANERQARRLRTGGEG